MNSHLHTPFKRITNANFKYILFDLRKEWIKLVYPHAQTFLAMITLIPWQSYRYDGPGFVKDMNENGAGFLSSQANKPSLTRNIKIRGLNYFLFGGSVAEVYNFVYEKESGIHLHDYVDPTGDLDVLFGYTHYEFYEGDVGSKTYQDDSPLLAYDEKGEVSPCIEHMTRWVYEQFVDIVHGIGEKYSITHLTSPTAESLTIVPDNEYVQHQIGLVEADPRRLHTQIGDLHIVRKTEKDMIKIQMTIPYKIQKENSVLRQNVFAEHLIEFVLALNTEAGVGNLTKEFKLDIHKLNNVNVQTPLAFINSQIEGHKYRLHILNYKKEEYLINRHKFINHLQRIDYMIQMAIFLHKKPEYKKYGGITGMLTRIFVPLQYSLQEIQDEEGNILVNKNKKVSIRNILDPLEKAMQAKAGGRRKTRRTKKQLNKTRTRK